jgi:hypothetical protein
MTMKKLGYFLLFAALITACNNNKNAPDVSGIKVDLTTKRFDQAFFSIDTLNLNAGLSVVEKSYPDFLRLFLQNIVGVNDPQGIKTFYALYKPVYDSSQLVYKDLSSVEKQVVEALKYVKYYFPTYKVPNTLIPVIGPMNSREDLARMANGDYTPNFIGPDFIGVSLQFYLGSNFSLYNQEYFVNNVAPLYRSRRFSKEYIAADLMKLIVDDIFPDKSNTKPLVEQMIEKGKQWWMLDKLMPEAPDSIKTGYTQHQLDWCKENEALIWSTIIKNENLYSINPATIQTYIGEAPFTNVFSQEDSPGNIGTWIGWQMVKKYEEKKSNLKPEEIMQASAKQILEEGKYKPK